MRSDLDQRNNESFRGKLEKIQYNTAEAIMGKVSCEIRSWIPGMHEKALVSI